MLWSSSLHFYPSFLTFHSEVHLKDLLYQAEGEPDWVDEQGKVVNYIKLDTMGKIISIFTRAQSDPFNLKVQIDVYRTMTVPSYSLDELKKVVLAARPGSAGMVRGPSVVDVPGSRLSTPARLSSDVTSPRKPGMLSRSSNITFFTPVHSL